MQGVEILTSSQIVTEWTTNWTGFWITTIVVFAILLTIGILKYIETYSVGEIIGYGFIGVAFGLIGGALFGQVLLSTPAEYEIRYKVTISDQVSMTEFYEHYEVIDQDGKIFTVREKTND